MDFKQILEWFKLSTKQAFIICVISSILLFGTDGLLTKIGLIGVKEELKLWLGFTWLFSLSFVAANILEPALKYIAKKIKWYFNLKESQKRLHKLTPDEKRVLSEYIDRNTRTTSLHYSDGVAKELEAAMIIRQASNLSHYRDVFAYNIQPWAFEYLMKHPDLLK